MQCALPNRIRKIHATNRSHRCLGVFRNFEIANCLVEKSLGTHQKGDLVLFAPGPTHNSLYTRCYTTP